MQFNQTNNNAGDVNNAISQHGNVQQSVGDNNTNKQELPPGFLSQLWEKIKSGWKLLFG